MADTGGPRRLAWSTRVLLIAVAAVAWVGFVGAPPGQARPSVPAAPAPSPAEVRGTYLSRCAVCHGADGNGTSRGPGIAGRGRAIVDYELSTGRMPLRDPDARTRRHLPAFSPAMIHALDEYVAAFRPGGLDIPRVDVGRGDVSAGGELYGLDCAACHQTAGEGGALQHREAPALTESTSTQIAEAVRSGPGTMPAFGRAALSDHDLASLVAYVRYLSRPKDRGGYPLWHLGPLPEGAMAWIGGLGVLVLAVRWIGET